MTKYFLVVFYMSNNSKIQYNYKNNYKIVQPKLFSEEINKIYFCHFLHVKQSISKVEVNIWNDQMSKNRYFGISKFRILK